MDAITRARERGLVALRILLGFGFLYAGLEWLNFASEDVPRSAGGLPEIRHGRGLCRTWSANAEAMVRNPTQGFWVDLAANPTAVGVISFLVVFGELAIGTP